MGSCLFEKLRFSMSSSDGCSAENLPIQILSKSLQFENMSSDSDQLELPKAQVKRAVAAHLSAVVGADGKSAPFHVNKEATLAFSGRRQDAKP